MNNIKNQVLTPIQHISSNALLGVDARTRLNDTGDSVSEIDSHQLSEAVRSVEQLTETFDRCTDSLWERLCTVGLSYELPSSVRRFIGLTIERFASTEVT